MYYRGELVADLWGGWRAEGQPWQRDTLAMCFSTTKGVVSTALHLLADRGQIEYDAPVASYWPEFGQGGKALVTVRHVLTHWPACTGCAPWWTTRSRCWTGSTW